MKYIVKEKDLIKTKEKFEFTLFIGNFKIIRLLSMYRRIKRYNKLYGEQKFVIKANATDIDGNKLRSYLALYAVVDSEYCNVNTVRYVVDTFMRRMYSYYLSNKYNEYTECKYFEKIRHTRRRDL